METERMIYLVTEYASGGEIFGKYIIASFKQLVSTLCKLQIIVLRLCHLLSCRLMLLVSTITVISGIFIQLVQSLQCICFFSKDVLFALVRR